MMGPAVDRQDRLFYAFDLDDRVPSNHLLRRIDAVLDLSWLREELKPHYSDIGRPSILVLSRFSSGYLIANLAIKETDHGTTIR